MIAAADLISFTEYTWPLYAAADIHRMIASQLERVEQGEVDRLMLLVPPRHGKSELASRRFPAYYLGKHPERQFISASAGVTLAEDFGRDVRNIIASQLERVEQGEVDRLMLLVPPRHGKSELASRRFPAYYLGKHPDRQFISASAGVTLAEDFGRDVRNIIASPQYACLFDTRLAEDSQARGRWNTAQGGAF
jgi:hypothetical protein